MYRTLASGLPHNNRERVKHIGVGIVIGGKQNEAGRKQVQNWESVRVLHEELAYRGHGKRTLGEKLLSINTQMFRSLSCTFLLFQCLK